MAQGLFNLKQVMQAVQQGGWNNQVGASTYGAYFGGSGSGQYLTGPTTSALNFSTGSFTVEFWAFISAYGGADLTIMFSASNASADFQFGASASTGVYWHNSGNQLTSNATAVPLGKWVHMALVRSGTTASLFCNGIRYSTTTNSAAVNLTNFNIGSYQASPTAYMTKGWISNLRITNTAVYDPTATTLTLPLSNLTAISGTQLLTLQNATIVDNSANALTITNNGSVGMQTVAPFGLSNYKPPAVDYLVVAGGGGGGGANMGGGGGAGGLLQGAVPVPVGQTLLVTVGGGGTGGAGGAGSSGGGTNGFNSVFEQITAAGGGWGGGYNNVSGQKANGAVGGSGGGGGQGFGGSSGTLYQGNGGGFGSPGAYNTNGGGGGGGAGSVGNDAGAGNSQTIGGRGGAGIASAISGTLTAYAGGGGGGQRDTNIANGGVGGGGGSTQSGSAVGAGTANTGGGGGGASGSGNGSDGGTGGSGIVIISYPDTYAAASAVTGATVSTSGSGSIVLTGSNNNFINYAAQSGFALGTGDFTIEFWFYSNNTASSQILYDSRPTSTLGLYPCIYLNSGTLRYLVSSTDVITSSSLSNSTWYHVALARSGTNTKMFINGTQAGSTYSDSNNYIVGTNRPLLFSNGYSGGTDATLNGNMTNIRVVKGTALYTNNFTAPTAPLTPVSGTSLLLNNNSGAYLADTSGNSLVATVTGTVPWNSASPFATGAGYKNRVYTWTSSGSITF